MSELPDIKVETKTDGDTSGSVNTEQKSEIARILLVWLHSTSTRRLWTRFRFIVSNHETFTAPLLLILLHPYGAALVAADTKRAHHGEIDYNAHCISLERTHTWWWRGGRDAWGPCSPSCRNGP